MTMEHYEERVQETRDFAAQLDREGRIRPYRLYTYAQVAALMGASYSVIRNMVDDGRLGFVRVGDRRGRRISGQQYMDFIAHNSVASRDVINEVRLYTHEQIADLMGVEVRQIRRMITEGRIGYVKTGPDRGRRISGADYLAYLELNRVRGGR